MDVIEPAYTPRVRLRSLDLNLLLSLEALLSTRSVTAAARRLGLSQPTMSSNLARLRRHFADDLLRRRGNRSELTPRAMTLRPQTAQFLDGAERLLTVKTEFDPATATREFTVMTTDYGIAVIGRALHQLLAVRTPGSRVRFVPLDGPALTRPDELLLGVDALFLAHGVIRTGPHLDLLRDEWVVIASADNGDIGPRLTMNHLACLPWVVVAGQSAGAGPSVESVAPIRQLDLLGVRPKVAATAESFLATPLLVEGTDRIAVLQRRLAEPFLTAGTLRALPLPFEAVPLVEAAWWHPSHEHDSGHAFLLDCLREIERR